MKWLLGHALHLQVTLLKELTPKEVNQKDGYHKDSLQKESSQKQSSAHSMLRGFSGRPTALPYDDSMPSRPPSLSGPAGGPGSAWSSPSKRPYGHEAGAAAWAGQAGASRVAGQSLEMWSEVFFDRRLALLLALMACCALDPDAFSKYGLAHKVSNLMSSEDPRERYLAGEGLVQSLLGQWGSLFM